MVCLKCGKTWKPFWEWYDTQNKNKGTVVFFIWNWKKKITGLRKNISHKGRDTANISIIPKLQNKWPLGIH